ncbi:MAG: glutathionylspermidine synthase family protein [Eggerthellaceae bacterium]|nr:glutathionylspermidine synthase family protein [Eggerthellaceae bacterium]
MDLSCIEEEERYAREYREYVTELNGDERGRRAAWRRMGEGSAFYRGEPVAFSYLPRILGSRTRECFQEIAETTYGILTKVIGRYVDDPEYRREFCFDPRVEELVLMPTGYEELLPVARIDFVFNEDEGFKFVEFNTDSSSGMNETRESLASIAVTDPYQRFASRHAVTTDMRRQFEDWIQNFLRMYKSTSEAVDSPRVAIVACLDSPNPHIGELEAYRQLFEEAGCPCSDFDVRQLEFDGEKLVGRKALAGDGDVPIDCIWRFCIVVDLLDHWDEVQPFIEAIRQQKAVMIGGFRTQIVHDKQLFAVLRKPVTQVMLTPEERCFVDRHIPQTVFLDDADLDIDAIKKHRERWVLKPTDWYASINVTVGASCTEEEWSQLIDDCVANDGPSPYIVQEFCAPTKSPVIALYGAEGDFCADPQDFGEIFGVFVHAGEYAGVYLRQGPYDVIGSARAGLVTPVLWVQD